MCSLTLSGRRCRHTVAVPQRVDTHHTHSGVFGAHTCRQRSRRHRCRGTRRRSAGGRLRHWRRGHRRVVVDGVFLRFLVRVDDVKLLRHALGGLGVLANHLVVDLPGLFLGDDRLGVVLDLVLLHRHLRRERLVVLLRRMVRVPEPPGNPEYDNNEDSGGDVFGFVKHSFSNSWT